MSNKKESVHLDSVQARIRLIQEGNIVEQDSEKYSKVTVPNSIDFFLGKMPVRGRVTRMNIRPPIIIPSVYDDDGEYDGGDD